MIMRVPLSGRFPFRLRSIPSVLTRYERGSRKARAQDNPISSRSWVITRTQAPLPASRASASAMRRMLRPSRPLVGSSRMSTSGRLAKAQGDHKPLLFAAGKRLRVTFRKPFQREQRQ